MVSTKLSFTMIWLVQEILDKQLDCCHNFAEIPYLRFSRFFFGKGKYLFPLMGWAA